MTVIVSGNVNSLNLLACQQLELQRKVAWVEDRPRVSGVGPRDGGWGGWGGWGGEGAWKKKTKSSYVFRT